MPWPAARNCYHMTGFVVAPSLASSPANRTDRSRAKKSSAVDRFGAFVAPSHSVNPSLHRRILHNNQSRPDDSNGREIENPFSTYLGVRMESMEPPPLLHTHTHTSRRFHSISRHDYSSDSISL